MLPCHLFLEMTRRGTCHVSEEPFIALLVVFGEDACRKRVYNAAENYSRMMKVVLSLLRNHKKKTGGTKSLARMRKQAAWNTGVLEEILFSAFGAKNETEESQ